MVLPGLPTKRSHTKGFSFLLFNFTILAKVFPQCLTFHVCLFSSVFVQNNTLKQPVAAGNSVTSEGIDDLKPHFQVEAILILGFCEFRSHSDEMESIHVLGFHFCYLLCLFSVSILPSEQIIQR